LARVIKYLRGTVEMPLTLEADTLSLVKWWVDASYAVHPDMKSHTGGAMTLGRGIVYGTSTCQRINTKSSTEAGLVAVNEVLPQILWTRYFLQAQGYEANDSVIYQDNQSAILLEKNGKSSSSKRTRHLNIRYFFVTDRLNAGEAKIEYCPTSKMVADFFTKPLQGTTFRMFCNYIMNYDPGHKIMQDHRSVLKTDVASVMDVHLPCGKESKDESTGEETKVSSKQGKTVPEDNEAGWTLVRSRKKTRFDEKQNKTAFDAHF
jgi:hypothetical protein